MVVVVVGDQTLVAVAVSLEEVEGRKRRKGNANEVLITGNMSIDQNIFSFANQNLHEFCKPLYNCYIL